MGAAVMLAAMKRREDQVINDFRAAGAMSAASAKGADEIGIDDSRALDRLRSKSLIREPSPGKFYLDEEALRTFRMRKLRVLWAFIIVLLLILAAMRLGLIKS